MDEIDTFHLVVDSSSADYLSKSWEYFKFYFWVLEPLSCINKNIYQDSWISYKCIKIWYNYPRQCFQTI